MRSFNWHRAPHRLDDHDYGRGRNWYRAPQYADGHDPERDHNWPTGPQYADDHNPERDSAEQPELHQGLADHRGFDQDNEPHMGDRGRWVDHRPDGDGEGPSHTRLESDLGSHEPGQGNFAVTAEPQQAGAELGWDHAFAEAGGFEALLTGHLSGGSLPGAAASPLSLTLIDDLDIDFNTLIQNTLVQNTQIVFEAAQGGSIEVGGDVSAISSQEALINQSGGLSEIQHLA
jgi:hypothetical protein